MESSRGGDVTWLIEHQILHAAYDAGLTPWCGKFFFFLPEPTEADSSCIICIYSSCEQLHALTSVHMLQIQSTGNQSIVWTHENTARTRLTFKEGV